MKISPLVLASSALVLAANAKNVTNNHVVPSTTNVVANGSSDKETLLTTVAADPKGSNEQSANALGSSTATKPPTAVTSLSPILSEVFDQLATRVQAVRDALKTLDLQVLPTRAGTRGTGGVRQDDLKTLYSNWNAAKRSLQVFSNANTDDVILGNLRGYMRSFEQTLNGLSRTNYSSNATTLKNVLSDINNETNKVKASNGF